MTDSTERTDNRSKSFEHWREGQVMSLSYEYIKTELI